MKIAICGNSGSGKTLISTLINKYTDLTYKNSTSHHYADIVFSKFRKTPGRMYEYEDANDCWEDRHFHREFWHDTILDHNQSVPFPYHDMLEDQDVIDGIRSVSELKGLYQKLDYTIYIDGPESENEVTNEIMPRHCEFRISNNKTSYSFYKDLVEIMDIIGVDHTFPKRASQALELIVK